ncbi:hypothetical protein KSP40_PGU021637 [Platanthera guangdongensis]|uniref:Uncharacterized protein n=1 Tax=Platanthera guangdongensis TaxID=2320717 RepID=A0ABR2MDW0_9ASPA
MRNHTELPVLGSWATNLNQDLLEPTRTIRFSSDPVLGSSASSSPASGTCWEQFSRNSPRLKTRGVKKPACRNPQPSLHFIAFLGLLLTADREIQWHPTTNCDRLRHRASSPTPSNASSLTAKGFSSPAQVSSSPAQGSPSPTTFIFFGAGSLLRRLSSPSCNFYVARHLTSSLPPPILCRMPFFFTVTVERSPSPSYKSDIVVPVICITPTRQHQQPEKLHDIEYNEILYPQIDEDHISQAGRLLLEPPESSYTRVRFRIVRWMIRAVPTAYHSTQSLPLQQNSARKSEICAVLQQICCPATGISSYSTPGHIFLVRALPGNLKFVQNYNKSAV